MKKDMTFSIPRKNIFLFKQFVSWSCNGYSIAPLTDYANNLIYQELPTESEYFSSSDERLYLDL